MPVAAVIRSEVKDKGILQKDLAHRAHCDPAVVSRLLSGRQQPIPITLREILGHLGSAKAWLAATYSATDGLFTAPWPDGPIASTDPQSVYLKLGEEASEAQQALQQLVPMLVRKPEAITHSDREQIEAVLMQLLDLIRCGQILVAAACDAYGVDVVVLHRKHDEKLVRNGTISAAAARKAA